MTFLRRPVVVLAIVILLLTTIPAVSLFFVVGDTWQGILPTFTDELNFARVHTIGEGNVTDGNPYFFEHRDGPPLVLFGGAWLNALPMLAGIPLLPALAFNFVLWSLLFAGSAYLLLRELRLTPWISVFGTVFLYLESYSHVWRPANLQPVYPFYFLFYLALLRLIRDQSRKNVLFLGLVIGAGFYLFAYLWQIAVITLGLLFLYALVRKNWLLLRAVLLSSLIGGTIGLPVPLYILWLSRTSPYFWESMGRLGLVNTHLPTSEIIYSGGWIGVVLALMGVLWWRARSLREDSEWRLLTFFLAFSGLGLWIMQTSNLITGKWLETGEHVRMLLLPWLAFATLSLGVALWQRRDQLSKTVRYGAVVALGILAAANAYFFYQYFSPFITPYANQVAWQSEQPYAGPFEWLQKNEPSPVVVWTNPDDYSATTLPIFTRHFVLYDYWGILELLGDSEVYERYLVSQYFNNPTVDDLKRDLEKYVGRQHAFHNAKTLEREVKVCRLFFFWDRTHDCGTVPTSQSLLGEEFFTTLEKQFSTDIKPNIKKYLAKYHVTYILKNVTSDTAYHPEALGAKRVYVDDHFELYQLPL